MVAEEPVLLQDLPRSALATPIFAKISYPPVVSEFTQDAAYSHEEQLLLAEALLQDLPQLAIASRG